MVFKAVFFPKTESKLQWKIAFRVYHFSIWSNILVSLGNQCVERQFYSVQIMQKTRNITIRRFCFGWTRYIWQAFPAGRTEWIRRIHLGSTVRAIRCGEGSIREQHNQYKQRGNCFSHIIISIHRMHHSFSIMLRFVASFQAGELFSCGMTLSLLFSIIWLLYSPYITAISILISLQL